MRTLADKDLLIEVYTCFEWLIIPLMLLRGPQLVLLSVPVFFFSLAYANVKKCNSLHKVHVHEGP